MEQFLRCFHHGKILQKIVGKFKEGKVQQAEFLELFKLLENSGYKYAKITKNLTL